MNATVLRDLCRDCAAQVYGNRPPTPAYAEAAARLLMGTAAQESNLIWRRQRGYKLTDIKGAWGLWQTEAAAVGDNLSYLRRRPDVLAKSSVFVFGDAGELNAMMGAGTQCLMKLIHDDDRFACLMARVHYLRMPGAIPTNLPGQAAYWKQFYNTSFGKGTVDQYIRNFAMHIAPVLRDG